MPTTAPKSTQTMNRPALIDRIAVRTGMPASAVETAIRGFEDELAHQVAGGNAVSLQGSFRVESVRRPRRKARNPRTGESVVVAAHNIARFTVGAQLKTAVAKKGTAPLSAERAAKARGTATTAAATKAAPTKAPAAARTVDSAPPAKTAKAPRAKRATPVPAASTAVETPQAPVSPAPATSRRTTKTPAAPAPKRTKVKTTPEAAAAAAKRSG